ncbi:MAG: DUF2259 domain-containing protein [Treponema sp.]|nr:DUF2259 domain-containing protein [Treponema sp.]
MFDRFNKKTLCIFAVIVLGVSSLSAKDTATFVDLGFSSDGATFMFAQYGVHSGTLKAWADLGVVDVAGSSFVQDGRVSYTNDRPVVFGQDGSGAFHTALVKNVPLVQRNKIDHTVQGRPLFISIGGKDTNEIQFRNFETGALYRASLIQTSEGRGVSLASSFHINLVREAKDGTRTSCTVGAPQFKRAMVSSYQIRQVRVYGTSMVLVIEMTKLEAGQPTIRYMVETVHF